MKTEEQKKYHKEYKQKNKDKTKLYNQRYYEKNREKLIKKATIQNKKDIRKQWKENNKKEISKGNKEYKDKNKEKISKQKKVWMEKNRDSYNQKRKLRFDTDPLYKLSTLLRNLIKSSLKRKKATKKNKTENILGCSYKKFKLHIENQFENWMNWNNYGKYNGQLNFGWDLDHIIPIASATTEEELLKLNHYTNFKPLCSYTNRYIKAGKL